MKLMPILIKIFLAGVCLLSAEFASAVCASPTGDAGAMRWDASASDLQYCDGTNWKSVKYGGYNFRSQLEDTRTTLISNPVAPAVSGTNVYVITGDKLVVLNSSNINSITTTGTLTHSAFTDADRSVIVGNYLYIRKAEKIIIVNIANPAAPVVAGTYTDSTNLGSSFYNIEALVVKGSYAYALDGNKNKLVIVNVSNPAAPTLAAALPIANARALDVEGNYAYVVTVGSLQVVDVTTPTAPSVVGTYADSNFSNTYAKAVRSFANRVAVLSEAGASGNMTIVDVTNKASPSLLASWTDSSLEDPKDMARYGNYAISVQSNGRNSTNYISVFDITSAAPANPIYQLGIPGPSGASCTHAGADSQRAVCLNPGNDTVHVMDMGLQPVLTLPPVAELPGADLWVSKMAASGTYAVLLGGSTEQLGVIDISAPTTPVQKGQYKSNHTFNYSANDVAFDGSYAYMSMINWGEVAIVDVATNPNLPELVSTLSGLSSVDDLEVSGNTLYAAISTGIKIIDVANKAAPAVIATATLGAKPNAMYILGNYLYAGINSTDTLSILDISNPASPTVVGSVSDATNLGTFDSLAVVGNYLYVNAGSNKLTIIDISNKASPAVTANFTNAAYSGIIAAKGSYLYTNGKIVSVTNPVSPTVGNSYTGSLPAIVGTTLVTNSGGANTTIRSYSISTPTSATLLATAPVIARLNGTVSLAVSGTLAYATAATSNIFSIINISNPTAPAFLGYRQDATNIPAPSDVFALSGYAYVVGSNYLTVMNVSNSASPTVSGRLLDATNLVSAKAVYVSGNYAYVTKTNGLTVVDITNKALPTYVTQVSHAALGTCSRMVRSGNYLYVSCNSSNSMVIISIATPNAPTLVGYYQSATDLPSPKSIYKNGNYIYVSTSTGVTTINVSTPSAPALVVNSPIASISQMSSNGNYFYFSYYSDYNYMGMGVLKANQAVELGGRVSGSPHASVATMQVSGNYVYQVTTGGVFQILDISPKQIPGQINNPYNEASWLSGVNSVAVSGTTAYVISANTSRLTAVNVSNPDSPALLSTIYNGALKEGRSVALSGNYAFVGTANSGYQGAVVNFSNPAAMSFVTDIYQSGSGLKGKTAGNYHFWIRDGFGADKLSATSIASMPTEVTYDSATIVNPMDFAISGNYAYVCTSSQDLQVVNIANPASMTIVATLSDAGFESCDSVVISGNNLFVVGSTNTKLTVVSIATPTVPSITGSLVDARFTDVRAMRIVGNYLHLVNGSPKLLATVDITTPASPVMLDSTASGISFPKDMTFSGNTGYIADNSSLVIFEYIVPVSLGACTKNGEVIYDAVQSTLKYCKGTTYFAMGASPGAGGVGCVAPIGAPGQYQYFTATSRFKYCDGAAWVQVGN